MLHVRRCQDRVLFEQTALKPRPAEPDGALRVGQLPLDVGPRDQTRLKVLPSSSAKRLAKIGAVKL